MIYWIARTIKLHSYLKKWCSMRRSYRSHLGSRARATHRRAPQPPTSSRLRVVPFKISRTNLRMRSERTKNCRRRSPCSSAFRTVKATLWSKWTKMVSQRSRSKAWCKSCAWRPSRTKSLSSNSQSQNVSTKVPMQTLWRWSNRSKSWRQVLLNKRN